MDIIVCVKQVPGTTEIKMNKETNTIIREGAEAIINPFDEYAIEEGVRIKEKMGGSVTVLSMGIPKVADLLRETIAVGVDNAVLLTDRAFAGADTLATSYALATAIKNMESYDLIVCGKQAIDGDTAQVGPSLAEKLGIPHTTNVKKIEEIKEGYIRCQRMTDDGYETIEMSLPAVITVVKEINEPRLPSLKGKLRAKKTEVKLLTAKDIGADVNLCGLKGSPTQVIETFVPEFEVKAEMFEGSAKEQAKSLADALLSMKYAKRVD